MLEGSERLSEKEPARRGKRLGRSLLFVTIGLLLLAFAVILMMNMSGRP